MKKLTTSDRLRQIIKERNLKQIDILNACKPYCEKYKVKLNKNDLSQYISGVSTPRQDKLSILGMALNVNEVWLMGYNVPSARNALDFVEENQDGILSEQFSLTKAEKSLVNDFRKLSPSGQKYILQTMAMAVQTYSEKNNIVSNVELA